MCRFILEWLARCCRYKIMLVLRPYFVSKVLLDSLVTAQRASEPFHTAVRRQTRLQTIRAIATTIEEILQHFFCIHCSGVVFSGGNVWKYNKYWMLIFVCFNLLFCFAGRFGGESVERSLSVRPKPANCIPALEVVPLKLEDPNESADPSIVIFPSCTRVNRCGGCCNNNLLSCQPVAMQQITFEVWQTSSWLLLLFILKLKYHIRSSHRYSNLNTRATVAKWNSSIVNWCSLMSTPSANVIVAKKKVTAPNSRSMTKHNARAIASTQRINGNVSQ